MYKNDLFQQEHLIFCIEQCVLQSVSAQRLRIKMLRFQLINSGFLRSVFMAKGQLTTSN